MKISQKRPCEFRRRQLKNSPFSVSRRERERNQGVLSQGAEAKIILQNNYIIKDRTPKSYRIKILDDKIRKLRTRSETKIIKKLLNQIDVPIIEEIKNPNQIKMQFIKGKRLSEHLNNFSIEKQKQITKQIGEIVSKIHKENIAHGDLTTSNMILQEDTEKIFLIDFGLSFQNAKYEDKAVDIHLFKQALEAKHWKTHKELYKEFLKGYSNKNKTDSEKVLNQLIKVEKRGRYKH